MTSQYACEWPELVVENFRLVQDIKLNMLPPPLPNARTQSVVEGRCRPSAAAGPQPAFGSFSGDAVRAVQEREARRGVALGSDPAAPQRPAVRTALHRPPLVKDISRPALNQHTLTSWLVLVKVFF